MNVSQIDLEKQNKEIKKRLIYPPYLKYKEKFIQTVFDVKTMKMIRGTEIERKDKYWLKLYKKIDKIYDEKPYILKKGNLLYRCSTYKNPNNFGKSHINSKLIYFGLDFVISIWIALEIKDRQINMMKSLRQKKTKMKNTTRSINKDNNNKNTFYLHVYEITDDINYKYISNDKGTINEIDSESSLLKPCIHPQRILHGDTSYDMYNELGTEISFPRSSNYTNYFSATESYIINISELEKNRTKFIFEWNPVKALKVFV